MTTPVELTKAELRDLRIVRAASLKAEAVQVATGSRLRRLKLIESTMHRKKVWAIRLTSKGDNALESGVAGV